MVTHKLNMIYGNINLHNTKLEMTSGYASQLPCTNLPHIALSGRSNVGKSSLINTMLGRKALARVSGEPGKTITINYYNIDNKLYFVDLPGYGYAKRSFTDKEKWSRLTEAYFSIGCVNRIVLQLVDCKVGLTTDDLDMLEWLNHYDLPYIIVATKIDKLNKTELSKAVSTLATSNNIRPGTAIHLFSSLKGQGRDELWHTILSKLTATE